MGIGYTDVSFDNLITDLSSCCPGKTVCGTCDKSACLIGFAQNCLVDCMKRSTVDIGDKDSEIPVMDFKLYELEEFERGIANILKMCQSCKEHNCSKCLLNIIRNCYEIGIFGEVQPYEGSNLYYFNEIHSHHPQVAANISNRYREAGSR